MNIRKKTPEELSADYALLRIDSDFGIYKEEISSILLDKAALLRRSKSLDRERKMLFRNGILVLRICDSKSSIVNANNNMNETSISNTIIEFGDYMDWLEIHKKLEDGEVKSLKILIQAGDNFKELNIPVDDSQRILRYLIDGKSLIDFDCEKFVHSIKGLKNANPGEDFSTIAHQRDISLKKEAEILPGECIYLFTLNQSGIGHDIKHFAYYLGEGLYVSKFGFAGNLYVCCLQEMHKFYGTEGFVSMTKRG